MTCLRPGTARLHGPWLRVMTLALLACLIAGCTPPADNPLVVNGRVDLSTWDFKHDGRARLDGQWRYVARQFVTPGTLDWSVTDARHIAVPGTWDASVTPLGERPGHGWASYAVEIQLPVTQQHLGLHLLTVATAYRLYANGQLVASVGTVGSTARDTQPAYAPKLIILPPPRDGHLELLMQVANFHYAKGGMWQPLWIGSMRDLQQGREARISLTMFLSGAFLMIGLYHLILWLVRLDQRASLLFAVLCISLTLRGLTVDEICILDLFPDMPWSWVVRIEYASMLFMLGSIWLFVRELFPREYPAPLVAIFCGLSAIGAGAVLVLPVDLFTRGLYAFLLLILAAAIIGPIRIIRAARNGREGATWFVIGILAMAATTLYDVLISVYPRIWMLNVFGGRLYLQPLGILVFMISQSVVLAMRSSRAITALQHTSNELRQAHHDLDLHAAELEQRVSARTTELEGLNRELSRIATLDGLTQIGNRRFFDEQLHLHWSDHQRRSAPLALIVGDIDYFKQLNDCYGHILGDEVLKSVATLLARASRRPRDVVARYGGEEFVLLLSDTTAEGAHHLAEQMRASIESLHLIERDPLYPPITISFGIACSIPQAGVDPASLFERADAALYRAKANGRNRVELDTGDTAA